MVCLCFFSVFLGNIKDAFIKNPSLQNLLLDDFFKNAIHNCQVGHTNKISVFCPLPKPVRRSAA